ncbi:MAG: agmatinase [Hyphomicrobiales bacterium]|nr:agmatinase [Hyphomicrobiales bacterium]
MPDDAMPTFLGVPQGDLEGTLSADVAIIGAPHATPYVPGRRSHAADGPAAMRAAMGRFEGWHDHYDFDFGGPVHAGAVVDCGDLPGDPADPEGNRATITGAVRKVLEAGAVPVVLGGDDAVPIPVLAAYEGRGPLWVVQVDAHIDWRQERDGVTLGWSSTMRRASEMGWVEGIVQVGMRGPGSARPEDVRDAEAWGARLITARQVHATGVDPVAALVPADASCIITVDCDGLDPSVMPAVMAPAPGGLDYWQVVDLIGVLGRRCRIAGFDLVELAPQRDVNGLGARTAARIVCNALACLRP